MSKTITIHETKGIKNLHFSFPENKGVYLLVGPNGTGKTTLLICMDRICNPYAFARGFSHPKNIYGYDEYRDSSIRYDVNNVCVQFRKNSQSGPLHLEKVMQSYLRNLDIQVQFS